MRIGGDGLWRPDWTDGVEGVLRVLCVLRWPLALLAALCLLWLALAGAAPGAPAPLPRKGSPEGVPFRQRLTLEWTGCQSLYSAYFWEDGTCESWRLGGAGGTWVGEWAVEGGVLEVREWPSPSARHGGSVSPVVWRVSRAGGGVWRDAEAGKHVVLRPAGEGEE